MVYTNKKKTNEDLWRKNEGEFKKRIISCSGRRKVKVGGMEWKMIVVCECHSKQVLSCRKYIKYIHCLMKDVMISSHMDNKNYVID